MSNSEFSPADYAAMTGNNGSVFGNDGLWLIVLLLFFGNGNWGNGGYGYNGGNGGGGMGGGAPYIINDVQRGFDQSAVMASLNGISQGLANAEVSRCNAQTNILQAMNGNQAGLMSQLFAMSQAQQNCCCDAKMQVADVKSTVLSENCADRYEAANNTRDIIQSQQIGTQAIMDKLCQLELDGVKQNYENRIAGMQNSIDSLRDQVNAQNRAASQAAQTAQIIANNDAQTANLLRSLNPAPIPAYTVPAPFGCNCNNGCYNNCGC